MRAYVSCYDIIQLMQASGSICQIKQILLSCWDLLTPYVLSLVSICSLLMKTYGMNKVSKNKKNLHVFIQNKGCEFEFQLSKFAKICSVSNTKLNQTDASVCSLTVNWATATS